MLLLRYNKILNTTRSQIQQDLKYNKMSNTTRSQTLPNYFLVAVQYVSFELYIQCRNMQHFFKVLVSLNVYFIFT